MSFVRSRPYGRSRPSGPEAWPTSPSRVEDRPLASFAAEPDNSIVPNAWSAPAAPHPSLPRLGEGRMGGTPEVMWDLRPQAFDAPLGSTAGAAAQESLWL